MDSLVLDDRGMFGNKGEVSDCVIPSMTALRSSADVQERVNARLQEWERAAATYVQGNCHNMSVYDMT